MAEGGAPVEPLSVDANVRALGSGQQLTHLNPVSLDRVLAPRSVAIVGASDDPSRIGGRPLRYLLESGFSGSIYPVNPSRKTVQTIPSFPSLSDLPDSPDTVLVAVSATHAADAVSECVKVGAKGAVVFTSGFAELGEEGRNAQEAIRVQAAESGLRLIGPNCAGVFNAATGFMGTFASALGEAIPQPGPLALVTQSGGYGAHFYVLARRRNLAAGYLVTTGNEADVDLAEALAWLALRDDTSVLVAQAEGIRNGERLLEALAIAHERRKPVIFYKIGVSEVGAAAAKSHTAALAGSDEVFDAVCDRYGVHRVFSAEEQLDVAYAASRGRFPAGRRVGLISISGGGGVAMCDAAEQHGLDVAPMPESTASRLKERLPFGSFSNPIDVTAHMLQDIEVLVEAMGAALGDGGYDAIVCFLTTVPLSKTFEAPLRDAVQRACKGYDDRLIVLALIGDDETVAVYEEAGFLTYEDPSRAIAAVAALASLREGLERPLPQRNVTTALDPADSYVLSEVAAKGILAGAGLPVPAEEVARDADEAVAAADRLGYPVALKVVSGDIEHKTDVGGVELGVADAAEVRTAYGRISAAVAAAAPAARVEGVLVTPMMGDGIDAIIGAHRDPEFGQVIVLGVGGTLVELVDEVVLRLAPVDRGEVACMLEGTKLATMLKGVRGAGPNDTAALSDAVVAVSQLVATDSPVISVEINPFRVFAEGNGAVALDAVVVSTKEP